MSYRFNQGSSISFGPLARRTNPYILMGSVADTIFSSPLDEGNDALLGGDKLAQLGARLDLVYNTTDLTSMPRSGFVVRSNVQGFAPELDCADTSLCAGNYYNATATLANYLSIGNSILALRVGGAKVFGDDFPLHDAAFIGGLSTLRGYRWNRFAGDAAVFGGTELRVPLTRTVLFTRGDLGVSALADAGRVWFNGDSDGGWHTGVGVGLWFHTLGQTVSVSYAKGEDEGRFYFKLGPAF
jgi:outer membrane protein assembly factor BamA